MLKEKRKNLLEKKKSQKGMSLLESLPLIMVLASLVGFLLGLWGMTHKNILHSIAARNYAFETFNHRANLIYFNDVRDSNSIRHSFEETELRFHSVGDGSGGGLKAFSTVIRFPANDDGAGRGTSSEFHRSRLWNDNTLLNLTETQSGTTKPWVMVTSGICINARCGGE